MISVLIHTVNAETCFFLPFLYWSCVINSIIGLRITVSGSTNIFTACVVFLKRWATNVTPHRHSEKFYKGDATLMWYISESNALICMKLETIFINMGGDSSSREGAHYSIHRGCCKSECQFINPKEDHNRMVVDEPISVSRYYIENPDCWNP